MGDQERETETVGASDVGKMPAEVLEEKPSPEVQPHIAFAAGAEKKFEGTLKEAAKDAAKPTENMTVRDLLDSILDINDQEAEVYVSVAGSNYFPLLDVDQDTEGSVVLRIC